MLVLWLMAAAAATVPGLPDLGRPIDERGRPVDPTIWLWNDDYTSDMGRTGGAVRFAASYKPDGTFDKCAILQSTGNRAVDEKACAIAMVRMRFAPSLGIDGRPKYRVFSTQFTFRGPQGAPPPLEARAPDFIFRVARLPDGAADLTVSVNAEVSADGALLACSVPAEAAQRDYAAAACRALPANWRPMIERNLAGDAVDHVRQVHVRFETAAPAGAD